MRAIVYPNLLIDKSIGNNPYIQEFIRYIELEGVEVINAPHKNPLLSLFFKLNASTDACFIHWIENVPLYKHGYLQTLLAIIYVLIQKLRKVKVIWFLHNKKPHDKTNFSLGLFLMRFMAYFSDLIITHSMDGVELVRNKYPYSDNKVYFLDHPTKDRLIYYKSNSKRVYDILIWGTISKYKGVLEFVKYVVCNDLHLKIRIIGKCDSLEYMSQLVLAKNSNINIENRSISFEELGKYISETQFVLIPYIPDSLLSSGILMDSLSLGSKVIGPNVGSFKDYSQNLDLKVFVFDKYEDINNIIDKCHDPINISAYADFLQSHSWPNFIREMLCLISKIDR